MNLLSLENLLTVQLLSTSGMFALIWLVQLVLYPAFLFVEPSRFFSFHVMHTARITWIVGPLMLLELAASLAWLLFQPSAISAIGFVLVVLIWVNTAFFSVPLHNRLAVERDLEPREALVKRLIRVNWIRTWAWTARLAICLSYFAQRAL